MARITNTKIVHHDGAVQWVMERVVTFSHQYSVYLGVKMLPLREVCAYRLMEARRQLRMKTTPIGDMPKPLVPRSMLADKLRIGL